MLNEFKKRILNNYCEEDQYSSSSEDEELFINCHIEDHYRYFSESSDTYSNITVTDATSISNEISNSNDISNETNYSSQSLEDLKQILDDRKITQDTLTNNNIKIKIDRRKKDTIIAALNAIDALNNSNTSNEDSEDDLDDYNSEDTEEDIISLDIYAGENKNYLKEVENISWKEHYIYSTLLSPTSLYAIKNTISPTTFAIWKLDFKFYCESYWIGRNQPMITTPQKIRKKTKSTIFQQVNSEITSDVEINSVESDVESYFTVAEQSISEGIEFWKSYKNRFPYLVALVRYFFSIYLTSVDVERLFSSSGRLITTSRVNLSE